MAPVTGITVRFTPPKLAIRGAFLFHRGMDSANPLPIPIGSAAPAGAALQQRQWLIWPRLSSGLAAAERFLGAAGFDRAPWIAAAFCAGIAAWFTLPTRWEWLALLALCAAAIVGAAIAFRRDGRFPFLRQAVMVTALAVGAGCGVVWAKSAVVGAAPIARPQVEVLVAKVISREDRPAEDRARLILATRLGDDPAVRRVRVSLPTAQAGPALVEGATVKLRARLMPPSPPMLPGGYDFARTAWFQGLAATGTALGQVEILRSAPESGGLARLKRALSVHVRGQLSGTPGTIAAAFASGDRGAIPAADEAAMRDAGLTHLLSISGLHVSALIAAVYFVTLRLLALFPWLALRVRMPLLAAAAGALAGIGYTALTGAEVPTVRSCIGALLVLGALVLGREPLSMRMVAIAALAVMLFWPEATIGPSFQMSFAAVIAIVALHGAEPVRRFTAPRGEGWPLRWGRNLVMLLATGVVIELALMPIGLFHFHRAGVYGALANVIAIPLTTFITMPLIALALLLDLLGLGTPVWWLVGQSLELLLGLARWTAAQPGAVTMLPAMSVPAFAAFVLGGLWLALWRGKPRLWGLAIAAPAVATMAMQSPPDMLVSGDGRHVGITGGAGQPLLLLRETRSAFVRDNLLELAGMDGTTRVLAEWPGARCSADFCTIDLNRDGRVWQLLIARSRNRVDERDLAAACDQVDIVIAERWLPRSCRPRWFKADRALLSRTGGLTVDFGRGTVRTVAGRRDDHGWWQAPRQAATAAEQRGRERRNAARPGQNLGNADLGTSHVSAQDRVRR